MIKGVIFDMDGVLVNNMAVHVEAFAEMARRYNLAAPAGADFSYLNGRGNEDIVRALFPADIVAARGAESLGREKEAIYREIYAPRIEPTKGLVALLRRLHEAGVVCAVGSSGPRENVDFVLERCAIEGFFGVRISGDMVANCKPDPEIFLRAAEGLGLEPHECLVFEDAASGIEAAHRAGMRVIAIASTHSADHLRAHTNPERVVDDFEQLLPDLDDLLSECDKPLSDI